MERSCCDRDYLLSDTLIASNPCRSHAIRMWPLASTGSVLTSSPRMLRGYTKRSGCAYVSPD